MASSGCPFAHMHTSLPPKPTPARTQAALQPPHPPLSPKSRPVPYSPFTYTPSTLYHELTDIIAFGHESIAAGSSRWNTLNLLLDRLLKVVDAEFGYFARLQHDPEGKRILKILSYTNIAWTKELQELVASVRELEFKVDGGGLYAEPLRTSEVIITEEPTKHPAYKGLPTGHPPLHNFFSAPIFCGDECIGTFALSNRNGKWDDLVQPLKVFGTLLGSILLLFDHVQSKQNAEGEHEMGTLTPPVAGEDEKGSIPSATAKYRKGRHYMSEAVSQVHLEDTISDGLVIFDRNLNTITCNRGAVTSLGFENDHALLQAYPRVTDLMAPLENGVDFSLVLDMSQKMVNGVSLETCLRKAGKDAADVFHVDMTITCFQQGDEVFYTALFRDIEREVVSRKKDEMLAFLSHEIRNPLQVIMSGLQIISDGTNNEIVHDMNRAANIVHGVINDTIDFVRISSHKFQAEITTVNLYESLVLCQRMYSSHQTQKTESPPPTFATPIPENIMIDERRLMQVLGNLLSNAFRHTAEGHVRIIADTKPTPAGAQYDGLLVLQVEDTGKGISPEDQARLFQFYTSINQPESAATEKSGLGLLLSREICRALGGNLWVESSKVGAGSTFAFSVPFWRAPQDESDPLQANLSTSSLLNSPSPAAENGSGSSSSSPLEFEITAGAAVEGDKGKEHHRWQEVRRKRRRVLKGDREERERTVKRPAVESTAITLKGLKILCVDDNKVVLSTMMRVLLKLQCITGSAENGKEAVDILTTGQDEYDIVLMDCLMPVMDGYTAVKLLKEGNFPKPIVAITGSTSQTDIDKCFASGFDDVLTKPVKIGDLTRVIQKWVPKAQD